MSDFKLRLKWLFSNSGIIRGTPKPEHLMVYKMANRMPIWYVCKCGRKVWSFKPVSVCSKFKCFKKNGGKWL
jgi:hypothetical protein